jgi:hypothetical protein
MVDLLTSVCNSPFMCCYVTASLLHLLNRLLMVCMQLAEARRLSKAVETVEAKHVFASQRQPSLINPKVRLVNKPQAQITALSYASCMMQADSGLRTGKTHGAVRRRKIKSFFFRNGIKNLL